MRLSELITVKTQPIHSTELRGEPLTKTHNPIKETPDFHASSDHEDKPEPLQCKHKNYNLNTTQQAVTPTDDEEPQDISENLTFSDILYQMLAPDQILPRDNQNNNPPEEINETPRAQRQRRAPRYLDDYVVNLANDTPLPESDDEWHPDSENSDSEIDEQPPPGYNVVVRRRQNTN